MGVRVSMFEKHWVIVAGVAFAFLVVGLACNSDTQKIREANEAARITPTPIENESQSTSIQEPTKTPAVISLTPLRAEIGTMDVEVGDCIDSNLPSGGVNLN